MSSLPSLRTPHASERCCRIHFAGLALLSILCVALPSHAAKFDESNPEALAQLEDRASHANPREQPFLYTQLVHAMTEQAGRQIAAGDTQQAAATLKRVNQFARLIHLSLARDAKRLKDAEELMRNSTYRLGQFLHLVPADDRPAVQDTLKQLDQVNDELLTQVFAH
jgi:hypothetical protein